MENISIHLGKDDQNDEVSVEFASENLESANENILCKKFVRKIEPEHTLLLNVRRSRTSGNCGENFLLHSVHGLHSKIPMHIISFDEKYVLRCLEMIRTYALRAAVQSFSSKLDILSDTSRISYKMARLGTQFPLVVGTENIAVSSTRDWIISRVTGSKSMMNILKSSLLHQFRTLDSDVNSGRSILDASRPVCSDSVNSSSSLHKIQKDVTVLDRGYGSARAHKRHISLSSTNSTYSDQTSSSLSSAMYQGMLQIIWKDGLPHLVFSIDDKEVYVANLSKAESPEDKILDYVYMFHSSKKGRKECDIREHKLELVGKMRVSSSITLCSNNSEIRETHYVLFGLDGNPIGETQASSNGLGKRLTRKVVNAFRSKQRSSSKFEGTSSIFEDSSCEPPQGLQKSLDPDDGSAENQHVSNLELAAIVVRDHYCNSRKESKLGGWGLKFLKNSGNHPSLETSIPSEFCPRNSGECSTSMNILLPAGFHGGPRTRNGGPSTLIDRWIFGGGCDCGGWDIGCPLTILNATSSDTDASFQSENSEECKSYNFFIQGSKRNTPIMKMLNIHDGLHYIHYQSTLSALQSFAIAAAIIHSHSPALRSKVYSS
ncbi:uncharacterized protein LOC111369576 [Olea europaea var. sylvestris]|uniref:uncharacterized protein LOC111369576 n=1 Tax=Olea europaea var. sylvestris TaxID=158386 RepID=UPI000C1CD412|nr:uncharacterized protein LOC111369576 [Olea europaea var. sylvestris]XP_022846915.1 uncharacterized protein LOC111369576 [Olea europaea var. sylvestris]XP_022846916.1 uncharacterized protein LOC111369576 [Olea europaea var. sylvestris]XP_022846917.1 uncharacterized protein LOC111369576 [Olea europaea var. sylvestris]XP_022846918.1 uncharacterized protein LOC111369576 [Olea europaea var. sylvestris]XP_022846919.1 uncharacterized protein LOC111369576 [Olea europaea var. sylvestris]